MKIKVPYEYNSSLLSNILSFFHEDLATSFFPVGHPQAVRNFLSLKGRCFIHTFIIVYSYLHSENTLVPKSMKKGDIYIKKVILFYSYILL